MDVAAISQSKLEQTQLAYSVKVAKKQIDAEGQSALLLIQSATATPTAQPPGKGGKLDIVA